MANPSSDNRTAVSLACVVAAEAATELDVSCVEAERAASDASISALHSFQDIIQHEYALVESIPDEDRAALMPIIRFVRNTLQDPLTSLYNLPQGCAMDALYTTERSRGVHRQDGNEVEGSHFKDMEMMPHRYAFTGTEEMRHRNVNRMVDIHKECAPSQRVASTEAFYQHWSFQGPQYQKEVHNINSVCPTFGITYPFSNSTDALQGDNAAQPQAHQGFALGSKGLQDPSSLASPGDHESELSSILSGMDMEGFHLEELRRSLRPSSKDTDSDVDGIDSLDVSNYGNNHYGDGDDDHDHDYHDDDVADDDGNMDENDESFLAYPHYDNGLHTSDVAWHAYWGNDLQYYPVSSSADNLLQFPKLHCRRRNVVKRVVGWVKKRASHSFASRVRHKRRCNLPFCTDCEAGIKRRKVTGSGSKRCAKLSAITKASPPSTATNPEKRENGFRQASSEKDGERDISAIYESLDGKEGSQVTRDRANAPLTTALSILLMDSGRRGMTMYEALHGLVQKGYAKRIGSDSQQALAAHVKTTLKEFPEFKELKNHRFVLRDRHRELDSGKQSIHKHAAIRKPHFAKSPKREKELSMSQEECSQALTKNLGASSSSKSMCKKKPVEGQLLLPQCRKTDGKHWRCMRNAKLGFLYCARHQQPRGRNPGHPPHGKNRHPCASDEEMNAAKEEEMSETVVDSCSGQSVEQDTEEAEPIRCCRTDGRNWQCSNQAEDGSLYCEHHQGRCKKGMVKGHHPEPTSISGNAKNLPKAGSIKQTNCLPIASRFAMQLRPRRNTSVITCLKDV